jgi:antitoxin component YwqK of YwqJK toxin-antitoxin module
MPDEDSTAREHTQFHKDGSIWAKGPIVGDTPTGYWEWFRKDGTKMRSGYFDEGAQVGNWTTYDRNGEVYKVTDMSRKTSKAK